MSDTFIYDGVSSADFDAYIASSNFLDGASRDVTAVSVPGRNGDLIISNNRFNNFLLTENVYIKDDIITNADRLRSFLGKHTDSYYRLEESMYPDVYRLARVSGGFAIETYDHKGGAFSVNYDCKPQRFLKSGDEPLQFFPVVVSGTDWSTQYVPVNGTIKFTATTASTLTVTLRTYDSAGSQLTSTNYSCANGAEKTKTFTSSDKYWRMFFSVSATTDPTYITVTGATSYNGKTINLNAKVGRNFEFENPTGYTSKPLIEFFATYLADTVLENYVNGEQQDWFSFGSNTMSNSQTHGFLDCELQYLYDETKANQSDKLRINTAQRHDGRSLVFPELGSGTITLNMYYMVASLATGSGLIQIYPKWWTL